MADGSASRVPAPQPRNWGWYEESLPERVNVSTDPAEIMKNSEGCYTCPHWGRLGNAVGHCWCPIDVFMKLGAPTMTGAQTCFAHICRAHPKYEARP